MIERIRTAIKRVFCHRVLYAGLAATYAAGCLGAGEVLVHLAAAGLYLMLSARPPYFNTIELSAMRRNPGLPMPAISILDLVRVTEATDARGALDNARDAAAHAGRWGYTRFWVAEHHNMPGIASAATSLVVSHIAAGTSRIRVGAGGIM
eukprot:gene38571-46675_t